MPASSFTSRFTPGCYGIVAASLLGLLAATAGRADAAEAWVSFAGGAGPGAGKHVVFVTGDDEYRSEESMPPLASILARRHGFQCTVLFAINKETGAIDPATLNNIPGLEMLQSADLMVLFIRFRELPDEQMKRIIDYTNSGKPILGLRTATHPFWHQEHTGSPYAKWDWRSTDPLGGYGREVMGEDPVDEVKARNLHYGDKGVQSTRGQIAPGMAESPLVRGCEDIWGPSDVYWLDKLSGDSKPVILGQVLKGMDPCRRAGAPTKNWSRSRGRRHTPAKAARRRESS